MMSVYRFEPADSRFTVQAFVGGMLSALGHSPTFAIRDFAGELRFALDAPSDVYLQLTIKANSLALTDSVSQKDREEIEGRIRQEVLETAAYPEIAFHSSQVKADIITEGWFRLQILGNLHLHGVQKPQSVDAQLRTAEQEARLSGQFSLLQSAFRIKPVTALGGTIKLKDELKFNFDLAGRIQNE
jgi:polyisoprenoid-binding protein YceI